MYFGHVKIMEKYRSGGKLKIQKFFIFILYLGIFILSGCVSNSKFNETTKNLSNSNDKIAKLESELSEATKSLSDSKDKITKLENELNDIKNGPQMSIAEIRKQYESKNYDKVLELATTLHTKFQGVPEDNEAQTLVKEIQDIKDKEAKKVEEDKAKLLAEQNKSAQDKARSIIRISNSYPSKPNSAGGVDLHIVWKNNSDKVIKYVDFAVEPYNAVNDKVRSEIGKNSLYQGRETGPFNKGQGNNGNTYWENAWYNSTIKTVQLYNVNIEYMDGTKISLKGDDLKYIQY